MATVATKQEQLTIQITAAQRALFEHAAELQGRSLDDFVVTSLEAEAEETIRGHEELTIRVSPKAYEQILEAIENPPPPNENLRRAFRRYREMFGE